MSDPLVRYVTLAYRNAPGVYRQSLMLLVSLAAHAPDPYEVVVATDRPERVRLVRHARRNRVS